MRKVNNSLSKRRNGLFALLRADMARVFSSWQFYTAIICVALLTLLNIWDELQYRLFAVHDIPTVFDMYRLHDSLGPELIILLCALPFASSFCTDWNNGYMRYSIIRSSVWSYSWSKVVVTAVTGFLSIFIGIGLLMGSLSIFLPWYNEGSLTMTYVPFSGLLSGAVPLSFFIVNIFYESLGYAFLAVFGLWVSTKITNIFVVLSSPFILCFGWQYLCGAVGLPYIVNFRTFMHNSLSRLQNKIVNDALIVPISSGYFLILILLFGVLFYSGVKRRMRNG